MLGQKRPYIGLKSGRTLGPQIPVLAVKRPSRPIAAHFTFSTAHFRSANQSLPGKNDPRTVRWRPLKRTFLGKAMFPGREAFLREYKLPGLFPYCAIINYFRHNFAKIQYIATKFSGYVELKFPCRCIYTFHMLFTQIKKLLSKNRF